MIFIDDKKDFLDIPRTYNGGDMSNYPTREETQQMIDESIGELDIPTKVSELENDSEFVNRQQLDEGLWQKQDRLVAGVGISIEGNMISATCESPFVELDALPEANEETYNLYKDKLVYVPSDSPTEQNIFDEYKIYKDETTTPTSYHWDKVGESKQDIDLSGYVKKTDVSEVVSDNDNPVSGRAVLRELGKKQDKLRFIAGVKNVENKISVDEDWFKAEVPTEEKGELLVQGEGATGDMIPIRPDLFVPYEYIVGESESGDRIVARSSQPNRDLREVSSVDYSPLLIAYSDGGEGASIFMGIPGYWRIYGIKTQPRVQSWLNLSEYVKQEALNEKADKDNTYTKDEVNNLIPDVSDLATKAEVTEGLATKQDKLISGTNVKTINGQSVLGEGNIEIEQGGNASLDIAPLATNCTFRNGKVGEEVTVGCSTNDVSLLMRANGAQGQKMVQAIVPTKAYADGKYQAKEAGKGLSTNDFSDEEKEKLAEVPEDVATISFPSNTEQVIISSDKTSQRVIMDFKSDEVEVTKVVAGGATNTKHLATKEYVGAELEKKQNRLTYNGDQTYTATDVQASGSSCVDAILPDIAYFSGKLGMNLEVGVEKWYGTYTEGGTTYQVYTKTIKIDALPATAGITDYPHGITGIKQILSAYGFGTNGFVLNAPRRTLQDIISIYQVQKAGNIAIEVGKDRSNMGAYIVLIYAKNN